MAIREGVSPEDVIKTAAELFGDEMASWLLQLTPLELARLSNCCTALLGLAISRLEEQGRIEYC